MIAQLLMATIIIAPLQEAIEKLEARTPVGSKLRSADWAQQPLALRESAQQTAGVESARVVNRIQSGLLDILKHNRDEHGVLTDRSKFIADIGKLAEAEGLAPTDPKLRGTIQDITSEARTELIYRTQTQMAYGHANWKAGQDPDMLDAFPAQELVRAEERKQKRDWLSRWQAAGGRLHGGRMIALKSDPVWQELSRFNVPWPPYDFNSGMGVEDVSREEAVQAGLIKPGQVIAPIEADFNKRVAQTVQGMTNEEMLALKEDFGPQLQVTGNKVQWETRSIADVLEEDDPHPLSIQLVNRRQAEALRDIAGQDLSRYEWSLDRFATKHVLGEHGDVARESSRGQVVVTREDLARLPASLISDATYRQVPGDANRFEVITDTPGGEETLSLWEVRPGRGLKKRISLVTARKYMNRAPHATAVAGRPAPHVRNVPGALNITPEQARINPEFGT